MIHAYDRIYLEKARINLGRMLDFAVYDLNYTLTDFFHLFISSGVARRFETGDFTVLAGMSGVELAYTVLEQSAVPHSRQTPRYTTTRSEEYWTGWALAYYQWENAIPFDEILRFAPVTTILSLYSPYHEMDIHQFCDRMNTYYKAANQETRLKQFRRKAGLSQSELAQISGIPVRTIQQYEQRQKNINKAQAEYLVALAQVLCCEITDLLEKVQ